MNARRLAHRRYEPATPRELLGDGEAIDIARRVAQHREIRRTDDSEPVDRVDAGDQPIARTHDRAREPQVAIDSEIAQHRPSSGDRTTRTRAGERGHRVFPARPVVEFEY